MAVSRGLATEERYRMALLVLRGIFVMAAVGLAVSLIRSGALPDEPVGLSWAVLAIVGLAPLLVIAADILIPRKRLDVVSSVYFGLIVGLVLA